MRFAGKVALVTGGAQGIGFATARILLKEGARVVIADVSKVAADKAVELMAEEGVELYAVIADLSTYAGALEAVDYVRNSFKNLDVLVNNVGGTIWKKPFWYYDESEIQDEVNRSFWPPIWCCRAAIDLMRMSGGSIVNIGSNAVTDGVYRVPYSASKGAVIALTETLAVELCDFNIRVNCLNPGGTASPARIAQRNSRQLNEAELRWEEEFIKLIGDEELLKPYADVERQAEVIAFLASDAAAHITGEIINSGRRGKSISSILGYVP